MKKVIVGFAALSLLICSCAQFANLNPKEIVARQAIRLTLPLLESYYDKVIPLAPSSRSVYPTAEMRDSDWQPGQHQVRADGTFSLSPGEHWFPVMTFCMKASGSSPNRHLYRLSKIQGSRAQILRDLHMSGLKKGYSPSQVQYLSWSIQSGARFESLAPSFQKQIRDIIPQHLESLKRSPLEEMRAKWDEASKLSGGAIPSFGQASEAFLSSLGDFGDGLVEMRNAHDALVRHGENYHTFSRRILLPGSSAEQGGVKNTPWSEIEKGVYARLVTYGHFQDYGLLQVRVRPHSVSQSGTSIKGTRASLWWGTKFFPLLPASALAEGEACTDGPGADARAFDPAAHVGDPGHSGLQPLAMGSVGAPPMANPLVAMAMVASLLAAAAAQGDHNGGIAKALEDLGKQISSAPQTAKEDLQAILDRLRNWNQDGTYKPPPKTTPGFPDLERVKSPSGRARWKDKDGNIYEWDGQHGELEKYDARGKNHDGGFDPVTGALRSPPRENRCTPK